MSDVTKTLQIIIDAKDNATSVLEGFSKKMDSFQASATRVGRSMVALGAAPTAALVGASKAAIDFESSFAGVRKTVDASEAEFTQLAQNFRNIAKETPLAVNDLNRIGEIAGSLGVSGVDNLTKFTKTIAQIGITTNMTEEEAAMAFGRIANIMQEPIKNVDKMGATVVDLGNKFAATEGEIVNFSERIAGAGKIAGLSTDEIFAIGAAMSSVGVEAEAGGTAVQKVLISMYQAASGSTSKIIDNSKAISTNTDKLADMRKSLEIASLRQKEFSDKTKESTKVANQAQIDKYSREIAQLDGTLGALNATHGQAAISANGFAKVLGVTNKQFNEMFKKDPSVVFEKFVNKLGEISKKGGDAAGVLEDLDLSDQRLIRSFLSLSNAGDLVNKTFDVGAQSRKENTALSVEAEKRYATTASQLQIFKNNLYDLGITIGSVVLPNLIKVLEVIKPFIERFAAFAQEHPKLIMGLLLIGTAIGAIGIAILVLAPIITALIGAFGAIVAIGPILLGVMGLIAAAVAQIGLIVFEVKNAINNFRELWNSNWFDIQGKTQVAADFIKQHMIFIRDTLLTVLLPGVGLFAVGWLHNWGGIQDKVKAVLGYFKDTVVPFMKDNFFDLLLTALDVFTGGWVTKFKLMKGAVEGLIGSIGDLINKAQELGNKAKGGLKIPGFQHGGFVPGSYNTAVPAILHGGERIIPRVGTDVNPGMGGGSGGGSSVNINISGSFNLDSDSRVQEFADKVIRIIGRQNELAGKGIGV